MIYNFRSFQKNFHFHCNYDWKINLLKNYLLELCKLKDHWFSKKLISKNQNTKDLLKISVCKRKTLLLAGMFTIEKHRIKWYFVKSQASVQYLPSWPGERSIRYCCLESKLWSCEISGLVEISHYREATRPRLLLIRLIRCEDLSLVTQHKSRTMHSHVNVKFTIILLSLTFSPLRHTTDKLLTVDNWTTAPFNQNKTDTSNKRISF